MATSSALDPDTEHRIRESISRQTLLTTLGVTIAGLASGHVVLDLPYRADLCQQNGYVVRAGRTLTVCSAQVVAWAGGREQKPVALMQATMMAVGPGPAGGDEPAPIGRPRT